MSEAIAQKLEEACALIEKGWCQRWFAKDADGKDCWSKDNEAVCFCCKGALSRVGLDTGLYGHGLRFLELATNSVDIGIARWNDAPERTQAEVVDAFKKAAELARGLK